MAEFVQDAVLRALDEVPSSWRILLLRGTGLSATLSPSALLAAELTEASNYARQLCSLGAATWSSRAQRTGEVTFSVNANGSTIEVDAVLALSGATSHANRAVSTIDQANSELEFATAQPFVNGDLVVVTAGIGGTEPTALRSGGELRRLHVVGATATAIQLSATAGGAPLALTGGVLPLTVRSANGNIEVFHALSSRIQIAPNGARTFVFTPYMQRV